MKKFCSLKVAMPHYWFVTWRGGEKVFRSLLDLFPRADIYTLFSDPKLISHHLVGHSVHTSCLDLPILRRHYQKLFPFYPLGVGSLKLREKYDLIISSESGPIKGIANPNHIPHVSYVHTPMRYCWGYTDDYLASIPGPLRALARREFERLRRYDQTTIDGVNLYLANSENVKARIKKNYSRDSEVFYPPIDLGLFSDELLADSRFASKDYYLSFGAITPYKGIDLLVDYFSTNDRKLIVVGEGSERKKLEARATSNIKFVGGLPYSEISKLILGAKALIFPGEEDFGMIPLEVMAHGVPVIALGKGGALETVVYDASDYTRSTGIFFADRSVETLGRSILEYEENSGYFNPAFIRRHAREFGEDFFKEKIVKRLTEFLS